MAPLCVGAIAHRLFFSFSRRIAEQRSAARAFPRRRDLVWKISLRRDGVLNVTQCSPNVVGKTGNAGDETAICACHNFRAVLLPKAFDNARAAPARSLSLFIAHAFSASLYSVQICRPERAPTRLLHPRTHHQPPANVDSKTKLAFSHISYIIRDGWMNAPRKH